MILLQTIPKRLPQKRLPYNYIREIGLKLIETRHLIENCKKYFDEYNEYVIGQRENINKLENERQKSYRNELKKIKLNIKN